jgi:hypothetical protein
VKIAAGYADSEWNGPETERLCWKDEPGRLMRVSCYTNEKQVELFLNGESLGVKEIADEDGCRACWQVPYQAGELRAVAGDVSDTLSTCGEAASLVLKADTSELAAMNGTKGYAETDGLYWEAEFGTFGYEYEMQKYLSRFNIRLQMSPGAIVHMWIQYDSDGVWHEQGELKAINTTSIMIPVIPRRCDHCKVKLTGMGHARVFSIARVLEMGGDG